MKKAAIESAAMADTSAACLNVAPSVVKDEVHGGGVVVIDIDRITTPRVMKEGAHQDVPKHLSVNLLSPKSTLIQYQPKKQIASTSTRRGPSIAHSSVDENRRCDDEEHKECRADADGQATPPLSFEPWVKPQVVMDASSQTLLLVPSSSIVLRLASSRRWEWLYLMSFLFWSILKPASQLLPLLEPFVVLPLLVMASIAVVCSLLALYIRVSKPDLINNARREEKRFWGLFFILTVRATAYRPTFFNCRCGRSKQTAEPAAPLPPLVRYSKKQHNQEIGPETDGADTSKHSRNNTTISWTCRICGTENKTQPFKQQKKHKHKILVVPFRNRTRILCQIEDWVDTNICRKCHLRWDYRPRKCADHLFHEAQEGPQRSKRRKEVKVVKAFHQMGLWITGEGRRKNDNVEEMIDQIQDNEQLYFMDYRLRDLQKSYLMPDLERRPVQYVEGEQVECCERQPFHLPAVIKRVHANHTYDVIFFSGELVKNAFAKNIRGRPIYRHWPWVQGMSALVLVSSVVFPAINIIPFLSEAQKILLMAVAACLLSTLTLIVMYSHLRSIIKPLEPLNSTFKHMLHRHWMLPFIFLWLFTSLSLIKVVGFLPRYMIWSLVLIPSYVFSGTLTLWLFVAKPVYGTMCTLLSVFWCGVEVTFGLWLDGYTDKANMPLVVIPFLPLWVFVLLLFGWNMVLPFTWDGALTIDNKIPTVIEEKQSEPSYDIEKDHKKEVDFHLEEPKLCENEAVQPMQDKAPIMMTTQNTTVVDEALIPISQSSSGDTVLERKLLAVDPLVPGQQPELRPPVVKAFVSPEIIKNEN